MTIPLTIAFITSRPQPCFNWFCDSLARQTSEPIPIIVVDLFADEDERRCSFRQMAGRDIKHVLPKPNIWGGNHRLPAANWWHVAACRNTALCLCQTEWIAFLDDRCVLIDGWLEGVKRAIVGNYIVAGAYEKRTGMMVDKGLITISGIISGEDARAKQTNGTLTKCHGAWLFGCNFCLPLEYALEVNGCCEFMDSMSMEDVIFGLMLAECGYPIYYDSTCKMVEDRTPSELGTPMKRTDKGKIGTVHDKSHRSLEVFGKLKRSPNEWNLRKVRESVLSNNPFPIPGHLEYRDWFDGQLVKNFV